MGFSKILHRKLNLNQDEKSFREFELYIEKHQKNYAALARIGKKYLEHLLTRALVEAFSSIDDKTLKTELSYLTSKKTLTPISNQLEIKGLSTSLKSQSNVEPTMLFLTLLAFLDTKNSKANDNLLQLWEPYINRVRDRLNKPKDLSESEAEIGFAVPKGASTDTDSDTESALVKKAPKTTSSTSQTNPSSFFQPNSEERLIQDHLAEREKAINEAENYVNKIENYLKQFEEGERRKTTRVICRELKGFKAIYFGEYYGTVCHAIFQHFIAKIREKEPSIANSIELLGQYDIYPDEASVLPSQIGSIFANYEKNYKPL